MRDRPLEILNRAQRILKGVQLETSAIEMFGRVTSVHALPGCGDQQSALRLLSAAVVKRSNATAAAPQVAEDEWSAAKPYKAIPGPTPLPILGNTHRFLPVIGELRDLIDVNFHEALHKKYGNILRISGIPGKNDFVFTYNPDDIEKVFRNEGSWPIRPTLQSAEYYRVVTRKDVFGKDPGLTISQGEQWQKSRTKVNQTMMQPRSTKLYISPINAVADDFIERIRYLRDEKQEMPEDFANELSKWALESIVYIALDTRLGSLEKELLPDSEPQKMIDAVKTVFRTMHVLEMQVPFWRIMSTPNWRDFVKANDYFLDISRKYINQALIRLKSLPEDSDRELTVLEKLLARDPDNTTAMVMAQDMMGAGIDTTSNSTAVALYYLAKYPEIQQKVFEEVQQYVPTKNTELTSDILGNLKYMKAFIKETMRVSPIAIGNQRELVKDLVLSGYQVPKGTYILMPLMYLSNKLNYYPDADKFVPERWLKDSPYTEKTHSFITLPFGFGPRMCVGRRFAELEIETVLAKIVRNFRLEYHYGDMQYKSILLRVPSSPLKFKMVERES